MRAIAANSFAVLSAEPSRVVRHGQCRLCGHSERTRIELLLAGGASQQAVGRKFGLSKDSVSRHWRGHVTDERKAMLVLGPVQRQALAAAVAEESTSVMDNLRIIRAGLYKQADAALAASDTHGVAALAGRLHENLRLVAKLTGELASSPLVQVNNTNMMLVNDPEFAGFRARLIEVLQRPAGALREAIAAKLGGLGLAAPVQDAAIAIVTGAIRGAFIAEFESIDAAADREPPPLSLGHESDAATA